MTSQKIGKLLLLTFYNSSLDFYYISPYIFNLIRGLQYLLQTVEISANKIKRKYIDINTMISDTISLFNCNTRLKYNDYSYFLGNEAIYNESAFLNVKIFEESIKRLIRKDLGDDNYMKVKKFNKQKNPESLFRDKQYEKDLEEIIFNNRKLISFHKKKKAQRLQVYLGRDNSIIYNNDSSSEEDNNDIYSNNKNKILNNIKFEEDKINLQQLPKVAQIKKKKISNEIDLLGLNASVYVSDDDSYQKKMKTERNKNLLGNDYSNINLDDITSNLVDISNNNNAQNNNSIKGIKFELDFNTIKSINSNISNYNQANNNNLTNSNFDLKNNPYEENSQRTYNRQNVFDFFTNNNNNNNNKYNQNNNPPIVKQYAKSPEHTKKNRRIYNFQNNNNTNNNLNININNKNMNNFFSPPVRENQSNNNLQQFNKKDNPIILQSNTVKNNNNNIPNFDFTKSNIRNNNTFNLTSNNNFNQISNNNVINTNNSLTNNNQQSNISFNPKNNYNQPIDFSKDYQQSNSLALKIPSIGQNNNQNNMSNNINISMNRNNNMNNMNNNRNNNMINNNMSNNMNNMNNNIVNSMNNNRNNNMINSMNKNNLNNNNNNNNISCTMVSNMTTAINNMQNNFNNSFNTNNSVNSNNNNLNISNISGIPINQTIFINNSQMSNINKTNTMNNNNIPFHPHMNLSSQTISTIKRTETANTQFSQDDMSFLSLNKNTQNQKEDFLRLSKNNPEVFGELKEKIYYYMSDNNQIQNIISKGYVGLMILPKFNINKKTFSLFEIQPQWKDNNIYQNKDFNPNLKKITETTYKIDIINKTNAIKFFTYSINPNVLNKGHIILPNFNINNNLLKIVISYMDNSFKNSIYKVEMEILLKKGKIINSDGKVSKGNEGSFIITYQNCVNESNIQLDNIIGNLNNLFKRIIVRFELKGKLRSNNEIKITYNNTISQTDELSIQKLTLLSYEYDF